MTPQTPAGGDRRYRSLVAGVTVEALDAAERRLGVALPSDYRALMLERDGFTEDTPDGTLMVYPLQTALEVHDEAHRYVSALLPGALFFGSDGSREHLVWDMRQAEPPVYLVDLTNAGWDEALLQAADLTSLIERFRNDGGVRRGAAES